MKYVLLLYSELNHYKLSFLKNSYTQSPNQGNHIKLRFSRKQKKNYWKNFEKAVKYNILTQVPEEESGEGPISGMTLTAEELAGGEGCRGLLTDYLGEPALESPSLTISLSPNLERL